jgi:hypothetical protein
LTAINGKHLALQFSSVAGVSLRVTYSIHVSNKVDALGVGDSDATALFADAGLIVDDIANEITIEKRIVLLLRIEITVYFYK